MHSFIIYPNDAVLLNAISFHNVLCGVNWCYLFLTSLKVLETDHFSSLLFHCLFILNINVTECHRKRFCTHSSPQGLWKGQGSWLDFPSSHWSVYSTMHMQHQFRFCILWFHFHLYKCILLTETLHRFRAGKVISISRAIYNNLFHIDSRNKGRGYWNRNLIHMFRCKPVHES